MNIIEKELIDLYANFLHTLTEESLKICKDQVKDTIEICKEQAKKEKTDNLPDNFGDNLLLAAKQGNLQAKKIIDKARRVRSNR